MTPSTLSQQDLIDELVEAIDDADDLPDRSGATRYDRACRAIAVLDKEEADGLVKGLIQVARARAEAPVEWWLRLFAAFQEPVELPPGARFQFVKLVDEVPPSSLDALGYVLRFAASAGCPMDWPRRLGEPRVIALTDQHPLLVADALVWSERFDLARPIIQHALKNKQVTEADLLEMAARWSTVLAPRHALEMNDAVKSMMTAPQRFKFDALDAFAEKIRATPVYYEVLAHAA